MIGEKPSTVRYILKKGTTADRLTWYVTYALKVLHEASPNADLPSRSTVYRLMDKGELRDARGRPLTHRRYKKNRRKPASTDVPRNHAPKHMVDDLPVAAVASSPLSTPTMAIRQHPAASICTPFQPFLKPP